MSRPRIVGAEQALPLLVFATSSTFAYSGTMSRTDSKTLAYGSGNAKRRVLKSGVAAVVAAYMLCKVMRPGGSEGDVLVRATLAEPHWAFNKGSCAETGRLADARQ